MDTNNDEISKNVVGESLQREEEMELEDTADKVTTSCKEIILDQEEPTPVKEVIEILNVELVAPAKITPENNEDEAMSTENSNLESQNEEKMQENKDKDDDDENSNLESQNEEKMQENKEKNDDQKEAEETIEVESKTTKNIDESVKIDNDHQNDDAQKSANTNVTTGLSLLAQYDSDNDEKSSDSESVIEVPITSNQDYRNQVVEINSDSDSDDSESDVEYLNELRKTIEKRIEAADDDEEEDEGEDNGENAGNKRRKPRLKVKGELLLEDLPPIHDLKITVPEDECIEFGKIHSIVDQLVLVSVLPNSILLDLETVLFLEKGKKVLGEVFDVLGQVADPLYCIRFNSNKQIKEKEITVGNTVYVAPKTQYTQYVILSNLMKQKGSDASWENDIEPPPRFLDYSDDEQEQLARRQLRNKDRPVDNDDVTKRPRTTEDDDDTSSVSSRSEHSKQHKVQHSGKRGGSGHYNSYSRPRNHAPNQYNQQPQNYHRGSWHSNYYQQPFPAPQSSVNYGMQPNQPYPSQYSMYPMHPMQNVPYAPLPTPYGAPPMMHQHNAQMMPNNFSVRPATLQGPPISHVSLQPPQQQYSPSPPSPPGSQ